MAKITRIGDFNSGHDQCPPVPLVEGSENVFIDGRGVGRVGDAYQVHRCDDVANSGQGFLHPPHVGHIATGSMSVFCNSRPVGRVGDLVDCPEICTVMQGSNDVFAGG